MEIKVLWEILTLVLTAFCGVLWYLWKRNDTRIDKMKEKYDAELEELRSNYQTQFNLLHVNLNQVKEVIVDRITSLELNLVKNFVTKEECLRMQEKHL